MRLHWPQLVIIPIDAIAPCVMSLPVNLFTSEFPSEFTYCLFVMLPLIRLPNFGPFASHVCNEPARLVCAVLRSLRLVFLNGSIGYH